MKIRKVSTTLTTLRDELIARREHEISMAAEVLGQYVTDHNDRDAYKEIDRQVNRLAKAWDKMIAKLERWSAEAESIEASADNFYGD